MRPGPIQLNSLHLPGHARRRSLTRQHAKAPGSSSFAQLGRCHNIIEVHSLKALAATWGTARQQTIDWTPSKTQPASERYSIQSNPIQSNPIQSTTTTISAISTISTCRGVRRSQCAYSSAHSLEPLDRVERAQLLIIDRTDVDLFNSRSATIVLRESKNTHAHTHPPTHPPERLWPTAARFLISPFERNLVVARSQIQEITWPPPPPPFRHPCPRCCVLSSSPSEPPR